MNSHYKVPIIPQNLNKNETIVQVAEVLDHLANITDDIFQRVNKRLENNSKKLNKISERLELVNSKVDSLKGAKKATQVFSSSKYPASECLREYESIFNDSNVELKRHNVKPKSMATGYEPLDKLQFYHVKVSSESNVKPKLDGLGDAPSNLDYVNDLLLYNTGKNLYKDFMITDSLSGPKTVKKGDNIDSTDIGAAPVSITERSMLTRTATQNYFYAPKTGEVPALDVPLDLPDLPGIADDLRYENDIGPGIAPSALTENIIENIADLPVITDTEPEPKTMDVPDIFIPPPITAPPITSEQPLIEEPPYIKNLPALENKPPENKSEAAEKEVKIELQKTVTSTRPLVPPVTDARASLMEAIRKAGGSKTLRSTEKSESTTVSKVPTNDLMADLHNKLLMRRKGISGNKKNENLGSNLDSTMSKKLSALIPPPGPKTDVESTSDEEWD